MELLNILAQEELVLDVAPHILVQVLVELFIPRAFLPLVVFFVEFWVDRAEWGVVDVEFPRGINFL